MEYLVDSWGCQQSCGANESLKLNVSSSMWFLSPLFCRTITQLDTRSDFLFSHKLSLSCALCQTRHQSYLDNKSVSSGSNSQNAKCLELIVHGPVSPPQSDDTSEIAFAARFRRIGPGAGKYLLLIHLSMAVSLRKFRVCIYRIHSAVFRFANNDALTVNLR